MKKNNNIAELKKVRLKIDDIDSKIIKLIADRFKEIHKVTKLKDCLLYTSPSPRDLSTSRMPSSA